jgi:starch phosphorylase
VFLKPEDPRFAHLAERLYIESDQRERFLKYTLLAKGASEYVKRFIGLENVQYIDLQEAYTAMIPLALRIPGRYRLIVHTPGPWGHPSFPNAFFREEYGYYFIEDPVVLTSVGAALAWEVILVSAKHYDVMKKVVPHFIYKARFITNGIELDRWMHPDLRKSLERGELTLSSLSAVRQRVRAELLKLLKSRKPGLREDSMIVLWARRLTRYKRPYFAARLVEEERDGGVVYVLGGKAHPHDSEGLAYMRQFKDLERKYPNVVYFHDYDVVRAGS